MRPNGNCCNGYRWPIELYFIAANWLDYALNSTIRDFETTVGHCYSMVMWFWDNYTDQNWAQVISIDVLHLPPLVGEKFLGFCNVSILIQQQDGIYVGRLVSGPLFPFRQVGPCGFFFFGPFRSSWRILHGHPANEYFFLFGWCLCLGSNNICHPRSILSSNSRKSLQDPVQIWVGHGRSPVTWPIVTLIYLAV